MFHEPVLVKEVLGGLDLSANDHVIDATLGGGGHAEAILVKTSPRGRLLGLDQDPAAIRESKKRLKRFRHRTTIIQHSFAQLSSVIHEHLFQYPINGILLDLGVSLFQFQDRSRGFSFLTDGPLDMRMSPDSPLTAAQILNQWPERNIRAMLQELGEESRATSIAAAIVRARKKNPFKTTNDLLECLSSVLPGWKNPRKTAKIHPATKTFQALRIAVNDELGALKRFLPQAIDHLTLNGRIAVISFHSLEDRIVKEFFKTESRDCVCPPQIPECRCTHKARLKIITKKPIQPTQKEFNQNPRSRSAKLRIAQRHANRI